MDARRHSKTRSFIPFGDIHGSANAHSRYSVFCGCPPSRRCSYAPRSVVYETSTRRQPALAVEERFTRRQYVVDGIRKVHKTPACCDGVPHQNTSLLLYRCSKCRQNTSLLRWRTKGSQTHTQNTSLRRGYMRRSQDASLLGGVSVVHKTPACWVV